MNVVIDWRRPDSVSSLRSRRWMSERVRRILPLLEREYGIPRRETGVEPLDVLIQTILSQNTNDANSERAYKRLRKKFPKWEDLLRGDPKTVVEALQPGGLARQKASRILGLLEWLKDHRGEMSLRFLKPMSRWEIEETLRGINGIGPKTLNCLLLFGLGREAFPVDTHILRVGKRIGFIPKGLSQEKAHEWMAPLVPKGKALSLHVNLIRHGRSRCKPRNPRCGSCFLRKRCLYRKEASTGEDEAS